MLFSNYNDYFGFLNNNLELDGGRNSKYALLAGNNQPWIARSSLTVATRLSADSDDSRLVSKGQERVHNTPDESPAERKLREQYDLYFDDGRLHTNIVLKL